MEEVKVKPIRKMNLWTKFLAMLPLHCSHCGKKYVDCHSNKINLLWPVPQNGKCCPDGHEGYTEEFIGMAIIKHRF